MGDELWSVAFKVVHGDEDRINLETSILKSQRFSGGQPRKAYNKERRLTRCHNTLKMSAACRWTRQLRVDYLSVNRGLCSSLSLSKKEESSPPKTWVTPHTEIKKESWNMPEEPINPRHEMPAEEWRGFLHQFRTGKGVGMDFLHYMQKGMDLRPSAIQKWWGNVQIEAAAKDQMYNAQRVAALGFDLAAAHFIIHRKGKVRFKEAQEWVQQDEDGVYELARHFQPGVFVEEIDARGVNLVYEGLESMKNLKHLKNLIVAGCPHIDDWCIDRICGEYYDTLEHLDISGCTKVTQRGVAALARLRKLRTLKLHGMDGIKDIKLLCLLLRDDLTDLKISGINYLRPGKLDQP